MLTVLTLWPIRSYDRVISGHSPTSEQVGVIEHDSSLLLSLPICCEDHRDSFRKNYPETQVVGLKANGIVLIGFNSMFALSWLSGGIVTLPLLGFSFVSVTLIVERLFFWTKLHRRQRRLAREVLLSYPDRTQFILQKLRQNGDLPLARLSLKALERDRLTPDEFRLALESAAQAEIPRLRRFNTIFETIITTAPLLGLLGTILGLIQAFAALKFGDIGSSETLGVTAGISEALVSTVLGLVVAIFTLIFANLFRGFYRRQLAFLQEYGGELELLHRQQQRKIRLQEKAHKR